MLKDQLVEVTINNGTIRWYKEKGYEVPTHCVQMWYTDKNGERMKNGVKHRVTYGTKIFVKPEDLPPKSNQKISLICGECQKEYSTTWQFYTLKKTDNCTDCVKKGIKGTGSHSYWTKQLITENPDAKCDISGETDKRFLVLHHLLNRKNEGINHPNNYVILSANYHLAFHSSNGGTRTPCTPEQYYEFKESEKNIQKN